MGGDSAYQNVPVEEKLCEEPIEIPIPSPKGFGARHMQALILFISLTAAFSMRAQLSMSMVAMTSPPVTENATCTPIGYNADNNNNETTYNNGTSNNAVNNVTDTNGTTSIETMNCTVKLKDNVSKWSVYRTYDWNKSTQEMILFSFFVGYTTMMLPMGIIAQRYGGKLPILVALLVNGVVSILTPWVPIFAGWMGVCGCRLLQGMTQAALYPSIHTILGKWAPTCERGRLSTYVYSGSQFGTILIFQISGFFAGIPSFGWPSVFWLCGVMSLACVGLFAWLGAATPQDHPSITTEELIYICGEGNSDISLKRRKTPWKQILTSPAVWGLIASHAGSATGYLLVLTETPTYMSKVLGVDIKHNGLYSSLPYIAMYCITLVFGYIADFCVARKIMSVANVRRIMNTIGMVVSGGFLVAFGFVQSTMTAVILLVLCVGLHSGVHVGFHINQIDLAPNFAGPIMAFGNMLANLTGLLVPVIVSNVVQDDVTNQHRWQIVFILLASFQFITNAIFVVFVKGTVQPWNFYGLDEDDNDDELFKIKQKYKMSLVGEEIDLKTKE